MRTYYLDSGVFCALFNEEKGRADVVQELLEEAKAREVLILTSTFALVEVLKVDGHKPLTKEAEQEIVDFFQYPFIRLVDPTRIICERARHLIWRFASLQPKDSVHLASAMYYSDRKALDGVFSYDTDFTKLSGKITTKFPITEPFILSPTLKLQEKKAQDAEATPKPTAPTPAVPRGDGPPVSAKPDALAATDGQPPTIPEEPTNLPPSLGSPS
jgi:predicted nucleic acid-binding protein